MILISTCGDLIEVSNGVWLYRRRYFRKGHVEKEKRCLHRVGTASKCVGGICPALWPKSQNPSIVRSCLEALRRHQVILAMMLQHVGYIAGLLCKKLDQGEKFEYFVIFRLY